MSRISNNLTNEKFNNINKETKVIHNDRLTGLGQQGAPWMITQTCNNV